MIGFVSTSVAVSRARSARRVCMSANEGGDAPKSVQNFAIACSAVAIPMTSWSEVTLATTGKGLPDEYGLIEGISYLVVVALAGWSAYTKVSRPNYTVVKRDAQGREVLRYDGRRLEFDEKSRRVVVEAVFQPRTASLTDHVSICQGDVLTEHFFGDRWYNVFRIESPDLRVLRGWYCNITRPAEVSPQLVSADDLELDIVVDTQGRITILDEKEFEELQLAAPERAAALNAVSSIQHLVGACAEFFRDLKS